MLQMRLAFAVGEARQNSEDVEKTERQEKIMTQITLEFSRVVRNVSGEGKQMHLLAMMLRKSTKKFESMPNPPGFHGHILYHLADKGCGNLSVILGMVLLRYNRGLARWLTHHHVITEAGMRMP